MHDNVGLNFFYQARGTRSVSDVQFVVCEISESFLQSLLVPSCVTLRTKKDSALIVVQTVNLETLPSEETAYFRADQPVGAGD